MRAKTVYKCIGIVLFVVFVLPFIATPAYATATATPANANISADTTGGSYTTLTGPVITEGANGDVGVGTIILTAPTGFVFNTGANVTGTIAKVNASSKACFAFSATTVTPTTSTITFTVNAKDGTGGNPAVICRVTFSNIQVRPAAGTPLVANIITNAGTAPITGLNAATNYGTLTETVGAKNRLALTTQPSSLALANTDFATKPVVVLQDQFGNTVTTDSTSTIARAAVLSTQACGGTAGSGTLTTTPANNAAVGSGILTYTAMQYSATESIKICFSSSGVTSVLSNAVSVLVLPTVTVQAASNVQANTATANGNITVTGGENNDIEGFVYDTVSRSQPGNVTPASSGYVSNTQNSGSFGTGAFTVSLSGLNSGTTYYGRAYSHNSAGYSYSSNEVSFLTKPAAPTNVQATDGTYTDKVTVTWTKSTGATTYHVWRDSTDLTPGGTGDVATYDDTGAGAPGITAGSSVASDGNSLNSVDLSLSGSSGNNGTTHTYKVVAYNATGNSPDSTTNTGYRGIGSLSYQWQVSAADSDAGYSSIGGATSASYTYSGAPVDGSGRYYKCVISAAGVSSQTSTADRGFIGIVAISMTTDGLVDYGQLPFDTAISTVELTQTQTIRNTGNIAEDFKIKTSNAIGGTGWTLGLSSGINTYVHEISTNGVNWTKFNSPDTYQDLASDISASSTQNVDLRLRTPTSSDAVQKTITITILAVQH